MRGHRDMMKGIVSKAAPWSGAIESDQVTTPTFNRVLLDCSYASAGFHLSARAGLRIGVALKLDYSTRDAAIRKSPVATASRTPKAGSPSSAGRASLSSGLLFLMAAS
jgi:hypothetical protein